MHDLFVYLGLAVCLFTFWAILRHDWLRLTRPRCRATGRVCGYRHIDDADGRSYAARYRFFDASGEHEVIDDVAHNHRRPPLDSLVELTYPQGHPELARRPRLLMWLIVYAGLTYATVAIGSLALELK